MAATFPILLLVVILTHQCIDSMMKSTFSCNSRRVNKYNDCTNNNIVTRMTQLKTRVTATSSSSDDQSTSDTSEIEMKKINALLREQGLTMDDMRKLREAVSSGQRFNKRESSSNHPAGLVAVDENSKRRRKSFDKLPLDVEEEEEEDDVEVEKEVSIVKQQQQSTSNSKDRKSASVSKQDEEDDVGYSLDDILGAPKKVKFPPIAGETRSATTTVSSSKSRSSSGATVGESIVETGPRKRPAIVLKNKSATMKSTSAGPFSFSSSSDNHPSSSSSSPSQRTTSSRSNTSHSDPGSIDYDVDNDNSAGRTSVPLPSGVTLQMMLVDLVDHHGFEFLYDQTNLKCFSVRPSINSSLKVLRKEDMMWARKKIEYLYFEKIKKK